MTTDRAGARHQTRGLATTAVHAGERPPRPDFTPTSMPIYPASAFIYEDSTIQDAIFGNERPGYVYTRYANPTIRAFEEAVAALEGTEDAIAFASGMGAIYAAIMLDAKVGDTIVAAPDVYGATYAILSRIAPDHGINVRFCDMRDLAALERVVAETRPSLVLCETMSNPLMRIANVAEVARIAHAGGAKMMIDNTFASPMLVNPAKFGADSVVHSGTKYIGGHGDATGGVVAASEERVAALREINKLIGAVLSPFDAWILLRGVKTLPLRVRQHSANAREVAQWLAADPRVAKVNYAGLNPPSAVDAQFNSADRGGMISFEIAGAGKDDVFRFQDSLRLVLPATTLGDVWSLVLFPANSSHRAVPAEDRATIGIGDNLVRLSVGIEDVQDIITDLNQALAATVAAM